MPGESVCACVCVCPLCCVFLAAVGQEGSEAANILPGRSAECVTRSLSFTHDFT